MSTLEISILITFGIALLTANVGASIHVARRLGRYSTPYVLLIWLAPVMGALFVLAKIRPAHPAPMLPMHANTVARGPATFLADPWPSVGVATEAHTSYTK